MNDLNFIFVWLVGWFVLSNYTDFTTTEKLDDKIVKRWRKDVVFLVFLPIFLITCLGTPRGDTWAYISNFKNCPSDLSGLFEKLAEAESGYGFEVFQFIINSIFGNNVTAFRILLAMVHSIPLVIVYRKYSENYLLSIYLFVASACHVAWMMNGLRQFVAVVIIFMATPLMERKRYVPLLGIILIASSFHISALLMIPIVFIVQGKAWNEKTIFYIVVALVSMHVFEKYTGVADLILQGTEFEGAVEQWQEWGDDGTNPIRVLVNAIPMLLAFVGRTHIKQEDDKMLNICVNMSIVTTGLYLVSMVTSGVMIGRLPIYTSLYSFILLPNLIPKIFTKSSAKIVYLLMIGCYMGYYLIEMIGY